MRATSTILLSLVLSAAMVVGQSITTISPSSAIAGAPSFTLNVNGTGFGTLMPIQWDGVNQTTTFVSSTQLTATIASSLLTVGTHSVRIRTQIFPTALFSNTLQFTVNNPLPFLVSLSPSTAIAGAPATQFTITGTGFTSQSTARAGATTLATIVNSSTQITATLQSSTLATPGIKLITVVNPTPGGGTSNSLGFNVNNPVPTLTSVQSSTHSSGLGSAQITLSGTNFNSTSIVEVGPTFTAMATSFVSSQSLSATLSSAVLASAGTRPIRVRNPTPGGGTSSSLNLTIVAAAPSLTSISPPSVSAGSPSLNLSLVGAGFHGDCRVSAGSATGLVPTGVTPTTMNVTIPASVFLAAGNVPVTVVNTLPGGQSSGVVNLIVNPVVPILTNVTASGSTLLSNQGGSLSVSGSGFLPNAIARINGTPFPVSNLSSTSLTVQIPANSINTPGLRTLTVENVGGTLTSNGLSLVFTNPQPFLGSIVGGTPITATNLPTTLTFNGAGFCSQSSVTVDEAAFPVAAVTATSISVTLPGSMLSTIRSLRFQFANPAPGGGTTPVLPILVGPSGVLLGVQPASMPVLTPTSPPFLVGVVGLNLNASYVFRVNGVVVPSTLGSSFSIDVLIPPTVPGVTAPGCVTITAHLGNDYSTNGVSLAVAGTTTPDNRGTVRLTPIPPAPGAQFGIAIELPINGTVPYTLVADIAPTPVSVVSPFAGLDFALGVGLGQPIPLRDGLGVFGPSTGSVVVPTFSFTLPFGSTPFSVSSAFLDGLTAPPQVAGVSFTLQALWPDATVPGGLNLTSIAGPHTL